MACCGGTFSTCHIPMKTSSVFSGSSWIELLSLLLRYVKHRFKLSICDSQHTSSGAIESNRSLTKFILHLPYPAPSPTPALLHTKPVQQLCAEICRAQVVSKSNCWNISTICWISDKTLLVVFRVYCKFQQTDSVLNAFCEDLGKNFWEDFCKGFCGDLQCTYVQSEEHSVEINEKTSVEERLWRIL